MSNIDINSMTCQACNKERKNNPLAYVCQECFDDWFYICGNMKNIPPHITSDKQQRRYVILACRKNNEQNIT